MCNHGQGSLDLNNLADPANVACGSFPGAPGYAECLVNVLNLNANDRRWQSFGFSSSFTNRGIEFARVLVPQSWLDENEENIKTILEDAVNRATTYYTAFGGATVSGSDQANSLSQDHRDAAFMVALLFTADEEAKFWGNLFTQMYDISDKTKFPPVFGSNHAGFLTTGPLKEDWTKPCPREWTFEERKEKCDLWD